MLIFFYKTVKATNVNLVHGIATLFMVNALPVTPAMLMRNVFGTPIMDPFVPDGLAIPGSMAMPTLMTTVVIAVVVLLILVFVDICLRFLRAKDCEHTFCSGNDYECRFGQCVYCEETCDSGEQCLFNPMTRESSCEEWTYPTSASPDYNAYGGWDGCQCGYGSYDPGISLSDNIV